MSDYLENLAARAIGKPDFLQPRMPSLFEPVLSEGPFSSSFSHSGIQEESEEKMGQEYGLLRHKQSQRSNLGSKSIKLPAYNSIETENQQDFKFEVQGRRNAIRSIDLPLKYEEHAATFFQGEKNQFAKEKPIRPEGEELSLKEENLGARAMEKSDFLQPRMPSIFEPVLSGDLPSTSFSHARILEETEEKMGQESGVPGHKQSPRDNPDSESVELPASNPIKSENPQGIVFGAHGRRDPIQSIDLPLKPEEQAVPAPQEEKGVMPDIRPDVEFNAANSPFQPKIQPSNRSKIERGLTKRRTDGVGIFQKALSIKKVRNGNPVFQSSPGRERAEILATRIIDSDSKEIAAHMLHSAAPGERSIISSTNPVFGLKKATAIAKSSKDASQDLSEQMPPSIKVTIGRIEVRAVTHPEKRETRTETKTPPSSLGDYLISLRGKSR